MKLSSLPRLLRTVRPMRPRQIVAQALHGVSGGVRPAELPSETPRLRTQRAAVPFLPAPPHAIWSGDTLELIGRRIAFEDPVEWHPQGESALFAFHLHQFDFLRGVGLSPERRAHVVLDWVRRHRDGIGWKPHPTSLRTLSWGKLLLGAGDLALDDAERGEVLRSLAAQVETLDRHLEVRLQANHLLSNLLGVVFGGLLLDCPHSNRWLRRVDWLAAEIDDQVLPDGMHVERSPMYHALLLENLLDLQNLLAGLDASDFTALAGTARQASARMLRALALLTHPDGEIALFGDAAFGIAHPPARIADYARRLGIEAPRMAIEPALTDGGFVRLEAHPFTLLASVAGPMPAHQPGHAHCDALAFELSVGAERVITDTGVFEYLPGALRDAARSIRSHATIEVDGCEQAELWAAHRVGGRPRVRLVESDAPRSFEASCAGFYRSDSLHRRRVVATGSELLIEDSLEGRSLPCVSRLPLAPGLEPVLEPGGDVATVPLASGRVLRIDLPHGMKWRVERAPYFPRFSESQERACLRGESPAFVRGRTRISVS